MSTVTLQDLGLTPILEGKVRQLFSLDEDHLLMVASDRISAFDVVMNEVIPNKGRVLTAMTAYWSEALGAVAPGSLVSCDPMVIDDFVPGFVDLHSFHGRSMVVRSATMLPLECIVRGRLAGQAFDEYEQNGTIHTMEAPRGLQLGSALTTPMFTPSTKAEEGHDLNISVTQAEALVDPDVVAQASAMCLALFNAAATRCAGVGLVLADTKFELGFVDGNLVLCDEVITPDSSRLWPADAIVLGQTPPAFDKQPFRDWLSSLDWDKTPPAPRVPEEIVAVTAARYQEAYERVTGLLLKDWYGAQS